MASIALLKSAAFTTIDWFHSGFVSFSLILWKPKFHFNLVSLILWKRTFISVRFLRYREAEVFFGSVRFLFTNELTKDRLQPNNFRCSLTFASRAPQASCPRKERGLGNIVRNESQISLFFLIVFLCPLLKVDLKRLPQVLCWFFSSIP